MNRSHLILLLLCCFLPSCKETIVEEKIPKEYTNDLLHANLVGKVKQVNSGAWVYVSQVATIDSQAISPSDGSFAFMNLLLGNYDLTVKANNYRYATVHNILLQGATTHYVGEIDLSTIPDLIDKVYPEQSSEIVYDWRYGRVSVSILFTQPMDRESVEKAFSTNPPSEGIFYWGVYTQAPRSDLYVGGALTEKNGFEPGATITTFSKITSMTYAMAKKDTYVDTTYTVTLGIGAKDTAGNALRFPLKTSFRTVQSYTSIYGIQTSPTHGDINVEPLSNYGINLAFPRRMNPASTEAAVTVTPPMNVLYLWPAENQLKIYTGGPYLSDTTITVTVGETAKDKDGVALGKNFSFSFRTAPFGVKYTYPANADLFVSPTAKISIQCNTYVQLSSAQSAFSISPAASGTISYGGYAPYENPAEITFTPSTGLQANTKYTVTISTVLKDMYGIQMKRPFSFSFVTRPN